MNTQIGLPTWVAPDPLAVRDLLCLAMDRVARLKEQEVAGMVATTLWLGGASKTPATAQTEPAERRDVALVQLCAAEVLMGDENATTLIDVCRLVGVPFAAPLDALPEYGLGVWLTLRWALGETPNPPLNLPIRHPDATLLTEEEMYSSLAASGMDRAQCRETAAALAVESRRLAGIVADIAATLHS
jgi:hypothetical protein